MVPKSDSATMVPHVRRWVRHHWLPSPAAATPPCQTPSPPRQHPSSTTTTTLPSDISRHGAEATTLERRREVTGGADDRCEKAAAGGSQLAALLASPTSLPVPLPFSSRLDSPPVGADQPHGATSVESPARLVTTALSLAMPLAMRGGTTWQAEGNTSGRSAASASSAEWSPPRGALFAGELGGGNAERPAGGAEGRRRSGASSNENGEARSDDKRPSELSPAHAANAAAPVASSRHVRSSPSRAHSPAANDGAPTPPAPPLPHAHSAGSPRESTDNDSRWWKHGGPSGGGWGLGRSRSSSGANHPRAGVNGRGGNSAPSCAGSGLGGGGGSGKVWWLGYRRDIGADYDIGDLVARGRTGEVRRATARKGARKGRRGRAEEREPPVVVKTICKAELTTDESREAVRREVAIQRMLPAHEHVAALVGAYEDHRNVYLVVQECEGGELMDLMMASGVGHAGEAAARHVVWQVLQALAHCHAHLVVHRDIKPENVLLAKSSSSSSSGGDHDLPHVKLIDFGLSVLLPPLPLSACPALTPSSAARLTTAHTATAAAASSPMHTELQEQDQQHHQQQQPSQPVSSITFKPPAPAPCRAAKTSLSSLPPLCVPLPHLHQPLCELVGSQDYLSPDVLRGAYGTPSDLFSLASLAYLLLCGRLPFSPSPRCLRATMHAVATQPAGFTESAWGGAGEAGMGVGRGASVSVEGRHAVQRLMAKDAALRPTAAMMLCHPWFHELHSRPALHAPTPPATATARMPASPATPLDPCVPLCLLHVLALPATHKHHLQCEAVQLCKDHAWVRLYAHVQCRHLLGVWPGDSMQVEQGGESVSVSISHVHKVLSLSACKSLADSFLKQVSRLGLKRARATQLDVLMAATLVMLPCAPGSAEPGGARGGEWDGRGREVAQRGEPQRGGPAEAEREATFEERVARSILVDELCPAVTPAALQSALGQFGSVRSVQMVPNLLHPRRSSGCAVVELDSRHLALKMIADISESILIVGAGPRPVRAVKARADMFDGAFVFPSALHAAALPQSAPAVTSAAGAHSSPLSAASALPGFRVTDAAGEGAAGGAAGGGSGEGGGAGQGRWRWRLTVMEERQRGGGGAGGGEGAVKKAGGGGGGGERGVGAVEWQRARRWKEVAGRQAEEMKMLFEHVEAEKQQVGERQRARVEEDLRRLTLIDHAMAPNGGIAQLRHFYGMPHMDWNTIGFPRPDTRSPLSSPALPPCRRPRRPTTISSPISAPSRAPRPTRRASSSTAVPARSTPPSPPSTTTAGTLAAAAAAAAGGASGDDEDDTGSRGVAAAVAAAPPRDPRAAAAAAAAARAGGAAVGGATNPAMTSQAMFSAGGAEEGGEEVQQRQPRVTAPIGGPSGAAGGTGGIGRFVGEVGKGKGSKRTGRGGGGGGGGGGGRIRTLGDIGRRRDEDEEEDDEDYEDDDDDDREEYYAGGEKSGIAVQDPNKRRGPGGLAARGGGGGGALDVDDIFARAQQQGARQGTSADLDAGAGAGGGARRGAGAFSGVGRTLGGSSGEGAGGGAGAEAATGQSQGGLAGEGGGEGGRRVVRHTVTFYLNGFTVDDGPLRQLHDPANAAFLKSILERGECPRELQSADPNEDVELNLLRNNSEWTPPPEPKYVAFSGQGRTLGDGAASDSQPPPQPPAAAAPAATGPTNPQAPAGGLQVDEAQPVTSIQVRLADGTRLVARFNHSHTVAHIRAFIDAARPAGTATRRYSLQTMGFPPKRLEDESETIAAAGLVNSVIVQR
ncbi:unnamed protein product [Closterium sp. Yama58-4]|nr:unnamed protein product [Closterium sp. Yama58-4]